jgi:PPOX class probable F420-dependent enzyme
MVSRRDQITMSDGEIRALLAQARTAHFATIGRNGRPHLVPLWFTPHGSGIATWTYRTSQKIANLRRCPQATILVETGDSYERLRGVSMECDVEVVDDPARIATIGGALLARYSGTDELDPELDGFLTTQARKRFGLVCTPTRTLSWDHTKLGGTY